MKFKIITSVLVIVVLVVLYVLFSGVEVPVE